MNSEVSCLELDDNLGDLGGRERGLVVMHPTFRITVLPGTVAVLDVTPTIAAYGEISWTKVMKR